MFDLNKTFRYTALGHFIQTWKPEVQSTDCDDLILEEKTFSCEKKVGWLADVLALSTY